MIVECLYITPSSIIIQISTWSFRGLLEWLGNVCWSCNCGTGRLSWSKRLFLYGLCRAKCPGRWHSKHEPGWNVGCCEPVFVLVCSYCRRKEDRPDWLGWYERSYGLELLLVAWLIVARSLTASSLSSANGWIAYSLTTSQPWRSAILMTLLRWVYSINSDLMISSTASNFPVFTQSRISLSLADLSELSLNCILLPSPLKVSSSTGNGVGLSWEILESRYWRKLSLYFLSATSIEEFSRLIWSTLEISFCSPWTEPWMSPAILLSSSDMTN